MASSTLPVAFAPLSSAAASAPAAYASGASDDDVDDSELSSFDAGDVEAAQEIIGGRANGKIEDKWSKRRTRGRGRGRSLGSRLSRGSAEGDLRSPEGPSDEAENDDGAGSDDLSDDRAETNRIVQRRPVQVSPEIRSLLDSAEEQYMFGRVDDALATLSAVVQQEPGLPEPFLTIASIHEQRGNFNKCLHGYLAAAELTRSAPDARPIWRKVAQMSNRQGLSAQALYAYKRSITGATIGEQDYDSLWELSQLYRGLGLFEEEIRVLKRLHGVTQSDEIACEIGTGLMNLKRWHEATDFMDACIARSLKIVPPRLSVNLVNMFARSLLQVRNYSVCAKRLIELLQLRGLSETELTAKLRACSQDLVAKLAAALCRIRPAGISDEEGRICEVALSSVLNQGDKLQPELCLLLVNSLLPEDAGDASKEAAYKSWPSRSLPGVTSSAKRALEILDRLDVLDHGEDVREQRAMCFWLAGRPGDAAELLEEILEFPGSRTDAEWKNICARAAEAWIAHGAPDNADRCLHNLSYDDLQRCDLLPEPISPEDRQQMFKELDIFLDKSQRVLPPPDELRTFVQRFMKLVHDCELDYRRINKFNLSKRQRRSVGNDSAEVAEREALTAPAASETDAFDVEGTAQGETEDAKAKVSSETCAVDAVVGEQAGQAEELEAVASVIDSLTNMTEPATHALALIEKGKQEEQASSLAIYRDPRAKRTRPDAFASTMNKSKRKQLGMESVEDFFGFESYVSFVMRGCELLRRAARAEHGAGGGKEWLAEMVKAVELCDAFLMHRRVVNFRNTIKRTMMRRLTMKLMAMAFETRMWRVAFKHLRSLYESSESDAAPLGLLARILFAHKEVALLCSPFDSDGASWEKFRAHTAQGRLRHTYAGSVTDVRAWALRQLLLKPDSFSLTLLCGHFCTISSSYPLAVAEYLRAHRLAPEHALTCLCLGVAYLSFAMSRTAVHRHDLILKGFTFIHKYRQLRTSENAESDPESPSQSADAPGSSAEVDAVSKRSEATYNLGRAFHQLKVLHLAVRAYSDALAQTETVFQSLGAEAAQKRVDIVVVRRSSAYNLAMIYRSQGNSELARRMLHRYIVV